MIIEEIKFIVVITTIKGIYNSEIWERGLKLQRAIVTDIQYGSRRTNTQASIMEIQVYYVTIKKAKGLGQRFEERRREGPADVFNIIIQKRPNTVFVRLKIDETMEGRRSHKEVRRR